LFDKTKEDFRFSVLPYQGTSTARKEEVSKYEVVITTYRTLRSERAKRQKSQGCTLFDIDWYRVVFHETHNVRNPKTAGHRAMCDI
jgi:SNF2 family DNA or RNA helicase